MYQGKRSAFLLLLTGMFVGLLSLVACGGGGSSSTGGTLPQTSIAPTAVLDGWTPADATLLQYKVYTFVASATDPNIGGAITEFHWDFGDGTTKTTAVVLSAGKATTTATYSYIASGTPVLSVVAKNAAGLLSPAVTRTVIVDAAPSPLTATIVTPAAALTINPSLGGSVSVTFTVNVVNTGTGTVSASGIQLNPGDATATQTTPISAGSGNWTTTVTYPAASAIGSRTATPTLKVVDSNGVSSTSVTGPVITVRTVSAVDNPPVITLVATPKIGAGTNSTYQNVSIDFLATAADPDLDTLTYTWTFGEVNGSGDVAATQAATALVQSHSYAAAGIYPVTFTANDGRGSVGIKSITLELNILANGPPTLAVARVPSTQPYANVPIAFTATVTDPNNDAVTLSWDFGDGSAVVTGQNPVTHSFVAAGSTLITVTADDLKGGVTTWTSTLAVLANRPPVSQLTTASKNLFQNKSYDFTATATDPDPGDSVAQYQWDFGDGSTTGLTSAGGATTTIAHTYASTFTGNASVKVRAVDSRGSTGDYSPAVVFPVVATPLPVVAFVSPGATVKNVDLGPSGTVDQAFTFTVTNPRAASGATDPIPVLPADAYIAFATKDPLATVTTRVSNGGGSYTFTVRYTGAAAAGTRTSTPTVIATDTLGIQGLSTSGPLMTITTLGANHTPTITITDPATPTSSAYTSKPISFGFTLMDADNDPVTYTVDWGDGSATTSATPTGNFVTGVSVPLAHTYADAYTATSKSAVITVTATDNRSANATAVAQTRTFTVTFNALPTAAITSPQDSGSAPTTYTPNPLLADTVVVPLNGKLAFVGTSTKPGSQDAVTTAWSLPGGVPSSHVGDSTGDVIFAGTAGVITPNVVTYTVTDPFGRSVSKTKTVLVDGKNTQQFNLSFQFRRKSDNNGTTTLTPVTTAINGLGTPVQIFQDGQSNTYNVQDQTLLTGAKAVVSIPVRSDLPFYIKIPGFSGGSDATTYLMRIPNAPTGAYADPSLVATPTADSRFSFQNAAVPYNPTLQVVTAQGFAAEAALAAQRKLNGYTDLVIGTVPVNERWLDRLSVPTTDPTGAFPWTQSSNAVGLVDAIPAYQLFAEWPTLLITRKTGDLNAAPTLETGTDPTTSTGTHEQLGFVLDYPTYTVGTLTHGDTFAAFSMQAFRVPAGVTDPYQLSPAWQSATAELPNPAGNVHSGLNPVPVAGGVTSFFQTLVNGAPGGTPLAGGIASLPLPYDPNDPERTPLALASATARTYSGIRSIFAFSEYLWSTVWARPMVLNSARPYFMDSLSLNTYPYFRYSNPAFWPHASGISPDSSAFDLTARGGGVFDASAPVAVGAGNTPSSTGVGRFYWTAYTPSYSGDASQGQVISRTWLADDTTKQPPTAFSSATVDGDATTAFGFMPPQDTIVDKRGRTAAGAVSGATLGGYRVTWYNATKDASGNPVAPDFWVVELSDGTAKSHFMLPGSYPAGTQSVSDAIMTDARTYLPSGNAATAGPAALDKVGPGYCWFDIPVELRPTAVSGVKLTVFGVKSILKNHPVAAARALNRPDWMDAIKTATATIKVLGANGTDLGYAHKVPFNYAWDIVVVNGPATYVAP
jgi:PKD repeat protein